MCKPDRGTAAGTCYTVVGRLGSSRQQLAVSFSAPLQPWSYGAGVGIRGWCWHLMCGVCPKCVETIKGWSWLNKVTDAIN